MKKKFKSLSRLADILDMQPDAKIDTESPQGPYEWSGNTEFQRIINNIDGARLLCEVAKQPKNMQRIYLYWLGLIAITPKLDAIQQQAALRLYITLTIC